MRKLKKSDLVGKTVVDADTKAANYLLLSFEDETELEIWVEPVTIHGGGGFFVDTDEDEDEDDEESEEG